MIPKKLKDLVKKQIVKSTVYWAGSPKMTVEELEAVEKFAKEKSKLFEKAFDTPEKTEKIIKMQNSTL